jgi:hypothetical protein
MCNFLSSIDPASPAGLRSILGGDSQLTMRGNEELHKSAASYVSV